MKKLMAIFLSCIMILTGCNGFSTSGNTSESSEVKSPMEQKDSEAIGLKEQEMEFSDLSDSDLLEYVEENVYFELVETLNSEEYFVDNVSAIYVSKEYLEEREYNSQMNIYFGYTLEELDEFFQGERYIFTRGNDGQTTVCAFEKYDDTYEQVIKNVATGAGVILLCVTVSLVSGAVEAPAISMIFAASAKSGTVMALSTGIFSAFTEGVVTGYQTGDFDKAIREAALAGSESFKWGAIMGAFKGGVSQTMALRGATLNGLTMNEAAQIQKEAGLPLEFIKSFHSMEEYGVYKNAGLECIKVNGQWAYTQTIDWDFVDDKQGRTNAERVAVGLAPLDSTGKPYELHHVGQKSDSPLAILTNEQHHKNHSVLHTNTGSEASKINRSAFNKQKKEFWKSYLAMTQNIG